MWSVVGDCQNDGVRAPLSELRIKRLAVDFLGSSCAPVDDVVDAVLDAAPAGSVDEDDVLGVLLDSGEFGEIDDALFHLPTLLAGTRWACQVSEREVLDGRLDANRLPHLAFMLMDLPLTVVDASGVPTGDTIGLEEVEIDDDWVDVLSGPPGWLDSATVGCIRFDFADQGHVSVSAIDVPSPGPALIDAFRTAFDACAQDEAFFDTLAPDVGPDSSETSLVFTTVDQVASRILADYHDLLVDVTVPPLDLLADAAGFEVDRGLVAAEGFDWSALRRWQAVTQMMSRWRLDPTDNDLLIVVLGASMSSIAGDDGPFDEPNAAALFAMALERPGVADAFWGEHDIVESPWDSLLAFVERIISEVPEVVGGVRWVAARCLDHLGRPDEALALLREAARAEIDHPRVFEMLARFEADHGNAPEAMRLLQRAEVIYDGVDSKELADHDLIDEVIGFATHRPPTIAGRNDPCPCGSRKKYKKCHLGSERHPLDDRAVWLFAKAGRFARDNRFGRLDREIAGTIAAASGRGYAFGQELAELPLVHDLTLAEGAAGHAFATERSAMLPDDEALLAAQWALVERSVFEVDAITDNTLALTDLRSGDRLTVTNITPNATTRPGALLLGRPLPVGDESRALSGFVPVSDALVPAINTALDDEDVFAIAELIGSTFALPRLHNTSGEPMRLHTITWSVPATVDIAAALTTAGFDDDGDGRFALLTNRNDDTGTVIASLTLDGATLVGECNSDERATQLMQLVDVAVPAAALEGHDIVGAAELMDSIPQGAHEDIETDQSDPEVRRILGEHVARYEASWLDDNIPALDGMTPRQCAADPVAREKLVRLLAQLPDTDDPTQMSARRLRADLGI